MSLQYPTRTFFTSKRLVDDKPILFRQAEDEIDRSFTAKEVGKPEIAIHGTSPYGLRLFALLQSSNTLYILNKIPIYVISHLFIYLCVARFFLRGTCVVHIYTCACVVHIYTQPC